MQQRGNDRIMYLEILRIIAMVAVMTIHIVSSQIKVADLNSYSFAVLNIYGSLVRFAVPLFVMISGSLFLDNSRPMPIKRLYGKYVLRLVIAFVFWSIFYATFQLIANGESFKTFIGRAIKGHIHMWFLPMIVCLYVIVPLLRRITASKRATEYFLVLALVFTFVIANLIKLPLPFMSYFKTFYSKTYFRFTLGYSSYFMGGYYIAKHGVPKKLRKTIYALGIIGYIATVLLTVYISLKNGKFSKMFYNTFSMFYNTFSVNVMLETVAIFTFGKYELSKIKFKERTKKAIIKLSEYSFGAYLVHVFFIAVLNKLGFCATTFNPLFAVPALLITVFALSVFTAFIMKKIPIVKKYLC